MVRVPGFEPGFRRWQRPVITTTLHSCGIPETRIAFLSVGFLLQRLYAPSNVIQSLAVDFLFSSYWVIQSPILVYG